MSAREPRFSVGQRVKYSALALRGKRDHYLGQSGAARERAKRHHDEQAALRGEVTAFLEGPGVVSPAVEVRWESGAVSRCLDYLLDPAPAVTWEVREGRASWHQRRAGHSHAATTSGFTSKAEAEQYAEGYRGRHPGEPAEVVEVRD